MLTFQGLLWWPPKRVEQVQQAAAEQAGEGKNITKEVFSPETAKLLAGLGNKQPARPKVEPAKSDTAQASLQFSSQHSHPFHFVTLLLVGKNIRVPIHSFLALRSVFQSLHALAGCEWSQLCTRGMHGRHRATAA